MDKYLTTKAIITEYHNKSKTVVLTHGVFDLFHIGHIKTLKESKKFGDILIVGVDSDKLVKKLKGNSRPIISSQDRIAILKENRIVDYVFEISPSQGELTDLSSYFYELYKYLQVDVITSGNPSEYSFSQRLLVEKLGLRYKLAGEKVIETTTSIINRINSI